MNILYVPYISLYIGFKISRIKIGWWYLLIVDSGIKAIDDPLVEIPFLLRWS